MSTVRGERRAFQVEAAVDCAAPRLLVDTGASVTALREPDAGARHPPIAADLHRAVRTANGTSRSRRWTDLARSTASGCHGVRAFVLPDELLAVNLLGISFLLRVARFEMAKASQTEQ